MGDWRDTMLFEDMSFSVAGLPAALLEDHFEHP